VAADEGQGVARVERRQDARVVADVDEAGHGHGENQTAGDRAEPAAHRRRAAALHGEQRAQHHERDRHHVGLEDGRHELEALDRREHRDRGRDRGVGVEQRRAGDREAERQRRAPAERALEQGQQAQRAALAPVVEPGQEEDVLDRDDDDERPEQERHHAQHLGPVEPVRGRVVERLAQRVERARADVPVDDTHGTQAQRQQARAVGGGRMPLGRAGAGRGGLHGFPPVRSARRSLPCSTDAVSCSTPAPPRSSRQGAA
jgi:hypothetical protein